MTRQARPAALWIAAIVASVIACQAAEALAEDDSPGEPAAAVSTADQAGKTDEDVEATTGEATSAADKARERMVDEILVTALREVTSWFDTPNTAHTITGQDIRRRKMSRTLPEALSETPGVMLQKTAHGHGSPYIRGFTSFRTLMMIDGVRLNNSVFRDGPNQYWNTVDPLTVSRLEVVKGPSSVLYGSDAIGGTVNAITRRPDDREPGRQWERRLYYRYSTAENSQTVRGEVSGSIGDRLGVLLGTSFKYFGNLDGGKEVNRQSKTGYQDWDGDIKLEYLLDPDRRLVFYHSRVDQDDIWRSHKTAYGLGWEGTTVGNEWKRILDQNRELTYIQYHATDLGGAVDAVSWNLSYHRQREWRSRTRNNGRRDKMGFDVKTLGAWLQLASPSPVGRWTYGVEYYYDWMNSFRKDYNADGTLRPARIQGPVADDATYGMLGVFIQNDLPVTDRADLILGGRYTHVRADARRVEDPATGNSISIKNHWDSLVGSARAQYRLDRDEHWMAFGGVSQGFRAPNLSDLTRLDTARTNEIETPSPNLDPEKFVQYEVGLKADYRTVRGQVALFLTDVHDLIMRTPTGAVIAGDNEVTKQNSGDGWIHGLELDGSWQPHPQWTFFGGFTYVDGEVETYPTPTGMHRMEPLDRIMPPTGHLGLRWDSPKRTFWAEGVATFAGAADKLSTRDKADTQRIPPDGTPGYATLTLRGGWNVNKDLSVFAAVENVTNEDYRIHGSGVNEPGTNLVVGLDWRF